MEEYRKNQLLGQLATVVANTFRVSTLVAVGIVVNSQVVSSIMDIPTSQVNIEDISAKLLQEARGAI